MQICRNLLDYISAKISASLQFSDWPRNQRRFSPYEGSETVLAEQKRQWVGLLVVISAAVASFGLGDAGSPSRSQTATAPDQAEPPIRHNVVAPAREAEELIDSGRAEAVDQAAVTTDFAALGHVLITE